MGSRDTHKIKKYWEMTTNLCTVLSSYQQTVYLIVDFAFYFLLFFAVFCSLFASLVLWPRLFHLVLHPFQVWGYLFYAPLSSQAVLLILDPTNYTFVVGVVVVILLSTRNIFSWSPSDEYSAQLEENQADWKLQLYYKSTNKQISTKWTDKQRENER